MLIPILCSMCNPTQVLAFSQLLNHSLDLVIISSCALNLYFRCYHPTLLSRVVPGCLLHSLFAMLVNPLVLPSLLTNFRVLSPRQYSHPLTLPQLFIH